MTVVRLSESSVKFTGLHGVTSQNIPLFIITAMKVCNTEYVVGTMPKSRSCWAERFYLREQKIKTAHLCEFYYFST
jgi:hypothetical protein